MSIFWKIDAKLLELGGLPYVAIGYPISRQIQTTVTTLAVAFFGVRWLYFEVEQNDKLFADKSLQCRPMLSNNKPVWTRATICINTSARTACYPLHFLTLGISLSSWLW